MSLERGDIESVGRTRYLIQVDPVPLEEDGTRIENQGAGHHDHLTVGLQRCWAIGDVEITGKVRARSPGTRGDVVNGSVGWAAAIRSRGENRPVGEQKSRTYFIRGISTAIGRRIPQLHRRSAGNGPAPAVGIVDFVIHSV